MNTIENHPTAILPAVFARDADRFTQITWKIVKVLSMALTILLPLAWVVQFAGLILKYLTFGLYLILYSLILWMPTMGLLLGTSWLWLRYWPLRPLLFIPGIVLALVGHFVLMCAHYDTDHDAVLWRVSFTEDWPLSWKLWKAMQGAT